MLYFRVREISTPVYLKLPSNDESPNIVDAAFAMSAPRLFLITSDGSLYTLGKDSYGAAGCYSNLTKPSIQFFHQQRVAATQPVPHGFFKVSFSNTTKSPVIARAVAGGAMHTIVSIKSSIPSDTLNISNALHRYLKNKYKNILNEKNNNLTSGPISKQWLMQIPGPSLIVIRPPLSTIDNINSDEYCQHKGKNSSLVALTGVSKTPSLLGVSSQPSRSPSILSLASSLELADPNDTSILSRAACTTSEAQAFQPTSSAHHSVTISHTSSQSSNQFDSRIHITNTTSNKRPRTHSDTLSDGQFEFRRFSSRPSSETLTSNPCQVQSSSSSFSQYGESHHPSIDLHRTISSHTINTPSHSCNLSQGSSQHAISQISNFRIKKQTSDIFKEGLATLGSLIVDGITGVNKLITESSKRSVVKDNSLRTQVEATTTQTSSYSRQELPPLPPLRREQRRTSQHGSQLRTTEHRGRSYSRSKRIGNSMIKSESLLEYRRRNETEIQESFLMDCRSPPSINLSSNNGRPNYCPSSSLQYHHRLPSLHQFQSNPTVNEQYILRENPFDQSHENFSNSSSQCLGENHFASNIATSLSSMIPMSSHESSIYFNDHPSQSNLFPMSTHQESSSINPSIINHQSSYLPLHSTYLPRSHSYHSIPHSVSLWHSQRNDIPHPSSSLSSTFIQLPYSLHVTYINGQPYGMIPAFQPLYNPYHPIQYSGHLQSPSIFSISPYVNTVTRDQTLSTPYEHYHHNNG